MLTGSPPPTRGKVHCPPLSASNLRITPAYAGKSLYPHSNSLLSRDHPRLRGEKFKLIAVKVNKSGSPPPTRGKVLKLGTGELRYRITPAYAGKSHACKLFCYRLKDHPRLRGEKDHDRRE